MNALDTLTYDQVLETVHTRPPAKRILLAQDLLKSLAPEIETSRPKRNTLKKALGLLATGQPTPTDEDIRRWLEERRAEKYG
jgi:hypothetical protein